jgi:predicted DNA-binding protein
MKKPRVQKAAESTAPAGRGADQFMVRFPAGVRERLAEMASNNGRSMNAEVIAAVEQALRGPDRLSAMEDFIEKYREQIKVIEDLEHSIKSLEEFCVAAEYAIRKLENPGFEVRGHLYGDEGRPITPEQAKRIRTLMAETDTDEARLLAYLGASSIETILSFERAIQALEMRRNTKAPAIDSSRLP